MKIKNLKGISDIPNDEGFELELEHAAGLLMLAKVAKDKNGFHYLIDESGARIVLPGFVGWGDRR